MLNRTIEKTLRTPAVARNVVQWAMKSVATTPNGSYYALITAKVFTAFMFEGTVDRLGETLCPTWNQLGPRQNRGFVVFCRWTIVAGNTRILAFLLIVF